MTNKEIFPRSRLPVLKPNFKWVEIDTAEGVKVGDILIAEPGLDFFDYDELNMHVVEEVMRRAADANDPDPAAYYSVRARPGIKVGYVGAGIEYNPQDWVSLMKFKEKGYRPIECLPPEEGEL